MVLSMSGRERLQASATDSSALPDAPATGSCQPSSLRAGRDADALIRIARKSLDVDLLDGMLHELSQPLGAVGNYAAVCLHYLAGDTDSGKNEAEVIEVVRRIAEQATRANRVARRLKCLVAESDSKPSLVDVNRLVEEVVSVLEPKRRLLGVDVQFRLDDRRPKIVTDRVQLMKVIAAILKNAMEAVSQNRPDCRLVTIGTCRNDESTVEITIEDSGPGLAGNDFDFVCSPSYTTKQGGLGLGLPVSRSLVENLGGRLEAASAPESGTVFRIVLPVRSKELNVEQ